LCLKVQLYTALQSV